MFGLFFCNNIDIDMVNLDRLFMQGWIKWFFFLDISNAFQNTILPNPAEGVYLSLPYLYLDWYKIKWIKHPLSSRNQKELCTQTIKPIQRKKPDGKLWYDLIR